MLRSIGSVTGLALLLVACGGGDGSNGTRRPTITAGSPPAGATGVVYPDYRFTVASGGAPPFTWSETGALPPGLVLSSAGELTGTPVTAGTYAFTVEVADSSIPALTGTLPVNLKIDAIVVSPGKTPPAGVHGTPYSFTFNATGGNLPLSWAVTAGTLPPGLTLNPDGTLSGTPTVASSTPFAFTVTVTDSSTPTPATSSVAYALPISEPPAPTINNTPPPTATVGSPYGFAFTATDGLAPLVWTPPTAPMGDLAVSLDGILSGTPSTAGIFPITLTVKDALNQSSQTTPFTVRVSLARPDAAFMPAGGMTVARDGHTATLLRDGRVLIAGGTDGSTSLASAELYDPASQTSTATGSMTMARLGHSATLLANSTLSNYGQVLVVGGGNSRAELYDPTAGTFTATGSMAAPRLGETATLLQNGQVLIAGGGTAIAELFNPSTGKFTTTGMMAISRAGHTATLLQNGRVLIAGGGTAFAELFNPSTGKFTATGSMSNVTSVQTATLLLDGNVLVTGTNNSAELFSPATGTFSVVGEVLTSEFGTTSTLRKDGTVLVAGGRFNGFSGGGRFHDDHSTATAELYAAESEGFTATGALLEARDGHTATLLVDGTVLVAGGTNYTRACHIGGCWLATRVLSSAEMFKAN